MTTFGIWALASIIGSVSAQHFAPLRKLNFPDRVAQPVSEPRYVGDLDADGDIDVLEQAGTILRQVSPGVFTAEPSFLSQSNPWQAVMAIADLDGDGDLDAVVAEQRGQTTSFAIFENRGAAGMQPTGQSLPLIGRTVALDFDNDGDLDLVGAVLNRGLAMLRNDGIGMFVPVANALPTPRDMLALHPADVDGDGDLDLLAGSITGTHVLANDGTGQFTDVTATAMPAGLSATWMAEPLDADGDGDLDVFASLQLRDVLLINDGTGVFRDESAARLPTGTPGRGLVRDIDGDGDPDLVFPGSAHRLNDGTGTFRTATQPGLELPPRTDIVADLDGDGDLDCLDSYEGIWWNDGRGALLAVTEPLARSLSGPSASVDIDGDGDLDVVGPLRIFRDDRSIHLNDGFGNFTPFEPPAGLPLPTDAFTVPFDIDGDGDPDLLHFSIRENPVAWENLGGLRFRASSFVIPRIHLRPDDQAPLQLDVDADGDLDLVAFDNDRLHPVLMRNDGRGTLSLDLAAVPTPAYRVFDFAALDVDGDGDDDLVMTPVGIQPLVGEFYRNDGTGRFSLAGTIPDLGPILVAADVDGDGHTELASAGKAANGDLVVAIHRRSGASLARGSTLSATAAGFLAANALDSIDLDGDGGLDLVLSVNRQWNAVARGTWFAILAAGRPVALVPADASIDGLIPRAAGDFDGDGDIDYPGYVNLTRQTRTPYAARVGFAFPLVVDAVGNTSAAIASVFAAPARRAVPLAIPSLGLLQLDEVDAFVARSAAVPAFGSVEIPLQVPNDPALAGAAVFFQTVLAESNGRVRLSNATRDTILR